MLIYIYLFISIQVFFLVIQLYIFQYLGHVLCGFSDPVVAELWLRVERSERKPM